MTGIILSSFMMLVVMNSSYGVFYSCEDAGTLGVPFVMSILSRRYPDCSQVDVASERVICEVNDQQDATILTQRQGSDTCALSTYHTACPDGSFSKTCYPVNSGQSGYHYSCVCQSVLDLSMMEAVSYWGDWQAGSWNQYVHRRQLLVGTPPTCIVEEYVKTELEYIISQNTLPDSVFSASSYFGGLHEPYRARIDNYFDFACSWVAGDSDAERWLQISLTEDYLVRGIFLKQRCDFLFADRWPTMISVTSSSDEVVWRDVITNHDVSSSYSSYDGQGGATVWFQDADTNHYWKIYLVQYKVAPSMKCDLIGYQKNPGPSF